MNGVVRTVSRRVEPAASTSTRGRLPSLSEDLRVVTRRTDRGRRPRGERPAQIWASSSRGWSSWGRVANWLDSPCTTIAFTSNEHERQSAPRAHDARGVRAGRRRRGWGRARRLRPRASRRAAASTSRCAGRRRAAAASRSITDEHRRPFELGTCCVGGHPLRALEGFRADSGSYPEPLSYHESSLIRQRMMDSGTGERHVTTECVSYGPLDTLRGYHLAWSSAGYGRH